MYAKVLSRARKAIRQGNYDMSRHTFDKMTEEGFDIVDIESTILQGEIVRRQRDDPRGTKYTIVGSAQDKQREVGVVGRFKETGVFLIITVYEKKG